MSYEPCAETDDLRPRSGQVPERDAGDVPVVVLVQPCAGPQEHCGGGVAGDPQLPVRVVRALNSMPCRTRGSVRADPAAGSAGSPASSATGTRRAAAMATAAVNSGCCSPVSYRRICRVSTRRLSPGRPGSSQALSGAGG